MPVEFGHGSSPLTRGKLVEGARLFDVVGLIPAHAGKTPLVSHRAISRPAHPRSRGENEYQVRKTVTVRGSSPLTRGKRDNDVSGRRQARLIPAHAGKTPGHVVTRQCAWAHPRSRGENRLDAHVAVIGFGSSPLTRGKPGAGLELDLRPRLIPAHAGKTSSPPSWEPGRAAHPRSRGENFLIVNVERKVDGSSPLTRGKRSNGRSRRHRGRLIPAHAGKTVAIEGGSLTYKAHPRSRGENAGVGELAERGAGSSPLTRGKRDRIGSCRYEARLIPAHAGKTLCRGWHCHGRGAHPRSRGENSPCTTSWLIRLGSSPLTRGKRHEVRGQGCAAGLIPAHAGKTGRWRSRSGVWTAHPRSRGENALPGLALPRTRGSSPLTRGKRGGGDPGVASGRLIPAHAGKTSRARREPDPHTAHPRSRGENAVDLPSGSAIAGSSPLTRGKR